MKTGIELIAEERQRQIEKEGWTPEHDDTHDHGTLGMAAGAYIDAARSITFGQDPMKTHAIGKWPWELTWFKPDFNAVRCLVKAGALIAAEIDRLQRQCQEGK